MRIEIDEGLEAMLDAIKSNERSIYGRGHVETVRFLADYYKNHKPLEALRAEIKQASAGFIEGLDGDIREAIERALPKALARVVTNLLTDAGQPQKTGDQQRPELRSGP